MKFAKTLANSEKDANGKTISNSKAQAVADEYERIGVLDDVIQYIIDNDIEPSVMGLSKTILKQLTGGKYTGSSNSSGSKKTSSGSSKKKSSSKSAGGGGSRISKGAKANLISAAPAKTEATSNKTKFAKAYANVFKRGSKNVSSASGGTVTCPRCGAQVSSSATRCPNCGAKL